MTIEGVNFSNASFVEIKQAFGLMESQSHPFLRDEEGNIVLFRGQKQEQDTLEQAIYDGAVYGPGAYLGNSPTSISAYAYQTGCVGVWKLPNIDEQRELRIHRFKKPPKDETSGIDVFPTRFTIAARLMCFTGLREDKGLKPYWVMLRDPEIIRKTTLVARLGLSVIGTPRP